MEHQTNTNGLRNREDIRLVETRLRFLEMEISRLKGSLTILILLVNLIFSPLARVLLDWILATH